MNTQANRNPKADQPEDDYIDKLVAINRTAKVVKGGRRFGFTALVVVGDGKGSVGFGKGKAKEVADARRKAIDAAKKSMVRVSLRENRTFHHDIRGRAGAGKVLIRTAPPGTGIIAGGPMRAIFEALGVQDVAAKSIGSSNPFNMVQATFEAFDNIQSPKHVAARRNKKVGDIVSQRQSGIKGELKKEVSTDTVETKTKKEALKEAAAEATA